jgi:hypothetical protein
MGSLARKKGDRPAWTRRQAANFRSSFLLLCYLHYNTPSVWAQVIFMLDLIVQKAGGVL